MNNLPIIVIGSGRSGTTWLLDNIAIPNGLRTIFEPFHKDGVKDALCWGRKYINENLEEPELKIIFDNIISGNVNSLWMDYRIRPPDLEIGFSRFSSISGLKQLYRDYRKLFRNYFVYNKQIHNRRLIIKFIKANIMLGWITKNYDVKIVFLLRHPCAVVESMMRNGWDYEGVLQRYLQNKNLYNDYLFKYKDIFEMQLTPIKKYTLIWSIENIIPLYNMVNSNVYVVFYENLFFNYSEWERLIRWLGLEKVPEEGIIKKPSQQISADSRKSVETVLSKWTRNLNAAQLQEIGSILDVFDVSIYNTNDVMPNNSVDLKVN